MAGLSHPADPLRTAFRHPPSEGYLNAEASVSNPFWPEDPEVAYNYPLFFANNQRVTVTLRANSNFCKARTAQFCVTTKQSRLPAWDVLQRLRLVLSEAENVAIPPPARKTFDAEGEALESLVWTSGKWSISENIVSLAAT
jgi:hypothetical protein